MKRQNQNLRYVSRWSGIVTLVALVIFFAALLQAGLLEELFKSEHELRVILPESGLSGLSAGANVEVLGTSAGSVDEIVLDPEASFYALVHIDKAMEPFVRSDSKVSIQKEFGIAGAAYLQISRGYGAALDWDYAVLTAKEEAAPTASMGELMDELRDKVLPVVDDTHRAIRATALLVEGLSDPGGALQLSLGQLSNVATRIAEGEGNIGRLLRDDHLMSDLEGTVAGLKDTMASISTIVANLETTSGEVVAMTTAFGEQTGKLPKMIDNTNATLSSIHKVMREIGRTMPEVTDMVRNSADASSALPTLLAQTQQTLSELEQVLVQLQGNWLLGGSSKPPPNQVNRLSPIETRP